MRLRLETAGEARKFSGKPNHRGAWHNDRDGISSVRRTNRTRGFWISQLIGQLSVAPCLSKWNCQERFPHLVLKTCASHVQRKRERLPAAREVLFQLTFCFTKYRVTRVFQQFVQANPARVFLLPKDGHEAFVASNKLQLANRGSGKLIRQTHRVFLSFLQSASREQRQHRHATGVPCLRSSQGGDLSPASVRRRSQ